MLGMGRLYRSQGLTVHDEQDLTVHDELSYEIGNPEWETFVNPHELKDSF